MCSVLKNFLDNDGCVKQWPAKRNMQLEALEYLGNKFPGGSKYTEAELNKILKTWHTFEDWALLRRELCEKGYFNRDTNGTSYVRTAMK